VESIGPATVLPQTADKVIDARAIPAVQDAELFGWWWRSRTHCRSPT
jgi:hypothetical protein